ncbi:cardiotrophin-2-like [Polyodon spathula]|uniref:cardiotrophin-2-like n=1 Tax=Polyodon spathula TaxID=7913 RepID=UPI001B7E658A|nr:cardiotrophin-2-like [Polyodon spathula]
MVCCSWIFLSLCLLLFITPDEGFLQDVTFSQSQRLSMKILKDVRSLRVLYNEEQFGGQLIQDSGIVLASLPSASMVYTHWLNMQDEERLANSSRDLHVYWVHVHANRMHLLGESEQSQLSQSMLALQMDLSDLTLQVNSQLWAMNVTLPPPPAEVLPPELLSPPSEWLSKLQGSIILRDLERYLGKVVRDFTLLKSRNQQ